MYYTDRKTQRKEQLGWDLKGEQELAGQKERGRDSEKKEQHVQKLGARREHGPKQVMWLEPEGGRVSEAR